MKLTKENKEYIDNLSYTALLDKWRFVPAGDPWFEGATGTYWERRMSELRAKPGGDSMHISASKMIGW